MADPTGGHINQGPPLRIPTEQFARLVVLFAHPGHHHHDIEQVVRSWDGQEIGPEQLRQLSEWERPPRSREATRHIPSAIRREVIKRDGGICQKCGADQDQTLDHIKPFSRGGRHTVGNLRVLCQSCNSSKGDRTDEEWRGRDG